MKTIRNLPQKLHPEPYKAKPFHSERTGLLAPEGTRLGVGIPGMRERMAQLGGRLDIISGPTGTTVRATISLLTAAQSEPLDASSTHSDRG